jgi:hypothetical protein
VFWAAPASAAISGKAIGVALGVGVAAAFGVTLTFDEAIPWASRLAAIEISVRKVRRDLGT